MAKSSNNILKAQGIRAISITQIILFLCGLIIIFRSSHDNASDWSALGAFVPFSIMLILEIVILILTIIYIIKIKRLKMQRDMVAIYLMGLVIVLYVLALPIITLID